MALIKCSECGSEISDQAAACPKCGLPLAKAAQPVQVHNPSQDQFLTRNRGCLEIVFWIFLGLLIIAGVSNIGR